MSEQEEHPELNSSAAGDAVDGSAAEVTDALAEEVQALEQDPAAELAQAQEQLAQLSKALAEADLRTQAEVQNVRRRVERDVANAHKYAVEKFAGDMLAVADNLERGLAAMPADDGSLQSAREGIELTLKVLLDAFQKHQVVALDPKDASFDPEFHEAMTMVPVPGVPANTVIDVLEKGYTLNGRLIRPARVIVAKGE